MSQIKGKNTKPEMLVRKYLFSKGFRYKLHDRTIPGKPDIVLPKYKTIIDIRGCFWHGHKNCKYGDQVKNTSDIKIRRIDPAVKRDKANESEWTRLGWYYIIVWDMCELEIKKKSSIKREKTLKQIMTKITGNNNE